MASRWAIGTTVLVLMLAACARPVPTSTQERSTGGSKSRGGGTTAAATATPAPVSLTVTIQGPTAEVVTAHGTKAAVGYRLAQAGAKYAPAAEAEVTVTDPLGRQLAGKGLRTDAGGAVKLPRIVSNATLVFVRAAYTLANRRVSLSALVATPRADGTATVDPATTLIAKKLEMLGRMNIVDVNAVPADMPAKLAATLGGKLTDEEVAAIGLLDPEPAARMLDARLVRDTALRDAFTAAVGPGGAITAFLQPLPRTAAPSTIPGAGASGTPVPGTDALPTTFPSDTFSVAPLTPEPTVSPSPFAVSAPPSLAPSPSPSVSPSVAPSVSLSPSPSVSPSASVSPSVAPSVSPSAESSAATLVDEAGGG